ncbi:hypothetical protein MKSMC1_05870 [Mycobacterium kansasii]|nr:hypothetical protein MKSMC1_05870 [Mycobacterium kansasii]
MRQLNRHVCSDLSFRYLFGLFGLFGEVTNPDKRILRECADRCGEADPITLITPEYPGVPGGFACIS